jgi:hypothetical protein
MTELDDAYAAWVGEPFPPGSGNDELGELHADLVLADTWVAESIIPYVEHELYEPAAIDVSAGLAALRSRATSLGAAADDSEDEALVARYVRYIDLLEQAYDALLSAQSS